jgi:hypothetical protein
MDMQSTRSGSGSSVNLIANQPARQEMVAVAAYYCALRRGFHDGDPLDDWLQAEAEIDRLLATTEPDGSDESDASDTADAPDSGVKASFYKRLDLQLKEWDAQFADLGGNASSMKSKARREYEAQLDSLAKQRATIKEKRQQLEQRSAAAWEELKASVEMTWQDLRKGMDQLAARFK